ncbi:hypothetical protein [Halotia branconii]|uniref:Uncharacterized protein n=1 Tax=Halotia branconii CENA392 TaxID=1539056 RepID=A0AAJ6P829_9CYAN|nr:hypothetical protein [Halotia branconii]WGV24359.1 hypothetical protein QI031_21580 [Halotia branconii CENA392]
MLSAVEVAKVSIPLFIRVNVSEKEEVDLPSPFDDYDSDFTVVGKYLRKLIYIKLMGDN